MTIQGWALIQCSHSRRRGRKIGKFTYFDGYGLFHGLLDQFNEAHYATNIYYEQMRRSASRSHVCTRNNYSHKLAYVDPAGIFILSSNAEKSTQVYTACCASMLPLREHKHSYAGRISAVGTAELVRRILCLLGLVICT